MESKNTDIFSGFFVRNSWKTLGVLLIGLLLTTMTVYLTRINIQKVAVQDFEFTCNYLQSRLEARLRTQAQILRSGAALFAVADTITREDWRKFYEKKGITDNFPGIQGYGFTKIIPKDQLEQHIQHIREEGFPDYDIVPQGERDVYTSIIYLEPFKDRNLRAFGYDMYSEPVRRKAMEAARDSGRASLSGKVILVQETDEDIQAGALMYVPVYRPGMPLNTVEELRAAIMGWVYSPYRIKDLTEGILGNWDLSGTSRIHLRIYDDENITDEALLFDSQAGHNEPGKAKPNISTSRLIIFNDKTWTIVLTRRSEDLTLFNSNLLVVLLSGILISLLLFFLASTLINTKNRATQIRLLNVQLEKLNADKSRFISILGHDLKNPFNSMLGFLDILYKDIHILDKEQTNTYLKYVNEVARNTYGLLNDLLQWTSAQSGKIPFDPQQLRFKDIWLHISKNLMPSAMAKNITVNYCAAEEFEVFADADMLKTIMRNLVSNAIKFTGDGGVIRIDAVSDPGFTTISVSDNGIGIEPGNLEKLFDISANVSTKGTAQEHGSGLGLIICREFITRHGGKIWAESDTGKGSRFIFTIPAGNGDETVQDIESEPELNLAITTDRHFSED